LRWQTILRHGIKTGQEAFYLSITFSNLGFVELKGLNGLLQAEEMFGPIVAL
jgi:hypothetical protein